jgi:hypothetical protein
MSSLNKRKSSHALGEGNDVRERSSINSYILRPGQDYVEVRVRDGELVADHVLLAVVEDVVVQVCKLGGSSMK